MKKPFKWISENEASKVLAIGIPTLDVLRELGYLKPGTHWRSSLDPKQLPWSPKVVYQISGCREAIEDWKKDLVSSDQIAV
tara:strand:- start:562 stop:804 length:243 start_codon:yes stop_codon:yes gene_type:complete